MGDVGWADYDPEGFERAKNTLASGLRGSLFHELIHDIMTYNQNNPDNMIKSWDDYIQNKSLDKSEYNKLEKETLSKLSDLGFDKDYLGFESRLNNYLKVFENSKMGALQFSE